MTNNLKEIQQVKALIAKGKSAGYLTFEEVSKSVPAEMSTPENFEEIIAMFDQMDIAIVDTEKEGNSIVVNHADAENDPVDIVFDENDDGTLEFPLDLSADDTGDFAARNTDPVRMYLREMGAVPLLDRDGEKAWNGLKQHLSNAPEELFGHPERFPQLLLLPER